MLILQTFSGGDGDGGGALVGLRAASGWGEGGESEG